jgi:hypothetical protein
MNKADQMEEDKVGYLSVHYIAKLDDNRTKLRENQIFKDMHCEIQVRTLLQHAWAEIEHDRNYKFGGVLPKEIKRRFFLAAGTLEMVDREFQSLSDDIDKYSEEVKEKTINNELDIEINSTSLLKYMSKRFDFEWVEKTFGNGDKVIIEELNNYGIYKLEDIEKIIPVDFINISQIIHSPFENFMSALRDIMIINDYKKYFKNCWEKHWYGIDTSARQLYSNYKIPIYEIQEYVGIDDEEII